MLHSKTRQKTQQNKKQPKSLYCYHLYLETTAAVRDPSLPRLNHVALLRVGSAPGEKLSLLDQPQPDWQVLRPWQRASRTRLFPWGYLRPLHFLPGESTICPFPSMFSSSEQTPLALQSHHIGGEKKLPQLFSPSQLR